MQAVTSESCCKLLHSDNGCDDRGREVNDRWRRLSQGFFYQVSRTTELLSNLSIGQLLDFMKAMDLGPNGRQGLRWNPP
jgi:hypothetical protein